MTFGIGVIGAGAHGTRYLRHATRDVPQMTAAACCRRNEKEGRRLAADFGCRYHREPADLIADPDVDGVIVCTPLAAQPGRNCERVGSIDRRAPFRHRALSDRSRIRER